MAEHPEPKTDPGLKAMRSKLHSELNWQGAKLTVAMCVVAVGTAFGAYVFILNDARAQTAPLEKRVETLEEQRKEDRNEQGNRMTRIEQNQNGDHGLILGVSQKLDALLSAQGVRNPAPTPKDGGQ